MNGKAKRRVTGAKAKEARAASGALAKAELRVRIRFGEEFQLGPGKADLLDAIDRTGSITASAKELGMSYRRAWLLIDEISRLFKRPVVDRAQGGAQGGGARLTDFGRALLAAYRRIEARTALAVREELAPFETDFIDL